AARTDELVRVIRRGVPDSSAFNEVHVPIMITGHGAVRIEFHRDGEIAAQTEATLLHSGTELVPITVPVPLEVRAAGPFDAVALRLDGDARTYALRRWELRLAPPAALLPDPSTGAELVFVDGEARRGVGVCAGRPVQAAVTVPADGWLAWSCTQPPSVRRPDARATLEVAVFAADGAAAATDHGGSPGDPAGATTGSGDARGAGDARTAGGAGGDALLVQRVAFESSVDEPSRWHAGRLALGALAGRQVVVSFRCSADDGGEAGCVVAEAALCRPDARGGRRPDVLLITSDTHRGDHLGTAHSGVALDTPALDALAARGVLFTDAFSSANVTNPSHMALMTGTSPRDIGILENVTALSDAAPTLAEAFRDAGYATWAVLSTEHLGPRGSGLGQGFDRASWPPHVPRRSGESVDVVERWLPERDGRPLFLWLHVFDAHWKYEPPPGFDRRYYPAGKDPDDPSLPPTGLAAGVLPPDMDRLRDLDFPRAQYRAEISSLDHELARLLEHSPLRDALTVFVGDHGECLGQHGIWFNHDGLYPDTLHVPLILAPPSAATGGGMRVTVPVCHLDVGRTLLDLAGLRETAFPGRDLPLSEAPVPDAPPRFALGAGGLCASVTWRGQHLILTLPATARRAWSGRSRSTAWSCTTCARTPAASTTSSTRRRSSRARSACGSSPGWAPRRISAGSPTPRAPARRTRASPHWATPAPRPRRTHAPCGSRMTAPGASASAELAARDPRRGRRLAGSQARGAPRSTSRRGSVYSSIAERRPSRPKPLSLLPP
ncbi:MAG TPA: sulfatase-like hydrolase/transferase, partial [Planctomycetota bacterium]|nr:sulfatase-like hydrolase/transferase [Planctomycetota bacterium]